MKKFILASVIFLLVSIVGILIDALCGYYLHAWENMPNLLYYALGWIAAGCYLSVAGINKK